MKKILKIEKDMCSCGSEKEVVICGFENARGLIVDKTVVGESCKGCGLKELVDYEKVRQIEFSLNKFPAEVT